jgi:hypothetical protein
MKDSVKRKARKRKINSLITKFLMCFASVEITGRDKEKGWIPLHIDSLI